MNVSVVCQICTKLQGCECKRSLTRFFRVLDTAKQRVSTHKPASAESGLSPVSVVIDKLSLELAIQLPKAEIISRLSVAGLKTRQLKLRDRRWYLEVGGMDSGFYFGLPSWGSQMVFRLITRPSAFESFNKFYDRLMQVFRADEIEQLRIVRLDLALDYTLPFGDLLQRFDFTRKQARIAYQDEGGSRTGITIGRGSEKIVVYDKARESGQNGPITRIEIQMTGAKLPTRSLESLQETLVVSKWNPFEHISLNDIVVSSTQSLPTENQRLKAARLSAILSREGFFAAKRVLNEQGNFGRDFGMLMSVKPWVIQPAKAFKERIADFFNSKQETFNGSY